VSVNVNMRRFELAGIPTHIVLGSGASSLAGEALSKVSAERALILTTAGRRALGEKVAEEIGDRAVSVLAIAEEHVPVEIAGRGRGAVALERADSLVAIGGGSTIGLAKAIALESAVATIAIPTTYSGSEMTPIWGLTEGSLKRTGRDDRVRPRVVLYDPMLSAHLPPKIAVPSAFNALAHAVETLYAPDPGDDVLDWAEKSVLEIVACLPGLASGDTSLPLRESALLGACLAGACLGRASMGLHHKLCHVLGGTFGLPHAATHAALLPFVAAFNLEASKIARERLCRALGTENPAEALRQLARASGMTLGLGQLGLSRESIARVAELATAAPYPNPRPVSRADLEALLGEAFIV